MHSTPQTMPVMRETAPQSAARLRRALRDRWPDARFSVRLDSGSDIRVSWQGGPSPAAVTAATRGYARTFDGQRVDEPTLWAGPRGLLANVMPGAERVVLEHDAGQ